MPVDEVKAPNLSTWLPDALLAAHLKYGGDAQSPGRLEEAAVRAIEECFAGVDQGPDDAKQTAQLFRSFRDPKSPRTPRAMLCEISSWSSKISSIFPTAIISRPAASTWSSMVFPGAEKS